MARSPFSLYRRYSTHNSRYTYYVQFWDPETRRYLPGRSIGCLADQLGGDFPLFSMSSKASARIIAQKWLDEGRCLTVSRVITLGTYCQSFWDWDNSEYIKRCRAMKRGIGKEYVSTCSSYIRRFLLPHSVSSVHLPLVTTGMLERFILDIKDTFVLSNKTCNEVMGAITKPLNEAARTGLIKESPGQRVQRLDKDTRRKGVLSSNELHLLFGTPWNNERVRIASIVSLSCGLRLGEILALRRESIGTSALLIDTSYNKVVGIKSTKNRLVRFVSLPQEVKGLLEVLLTANPYNEDFVFWGRVAGKPMRETTIAHEFNSQLTKIGIPDIPVAKGERPIPGSRQERNISFHSLRHLFNTLLRGSISDVALRESTGHSSAAMTDHYDHADHDVRLAETEVAVRSRILPYFEEKNS